MTPARVQRRVRSKRAPTQVSVSAAWRFNREVLLGECGALLVANAAATGAGKYTTQPGVISGVAVAGTLVGGAVFWLAARIYDRRAEHRLAARQVAADIGYFTPAAIVLGLLVYDPSIYLTSRYFLVKGEAVTASVLLGQVIAFGLFLLCLNIYRVVLRRLTGVLL